MEASIPAEVVEALTERFGPLEPAGAGAWSVAFRLHADRDLVLRVGEHESDFLVDAEMSSYRSPELPIPTVVELDRLAPPNDRFHVCVSTFAPGRPLEAVSAGKWAELVPAVADLLEAMRAVSPPAGDHVPRWPEVLSGPGAGDAADGDDQDDRLAGWRDRLADHPDLLTAYRRAEFRLQRLCRLEVVEQVPPTLLHCDLINRNVHISGRTITGVFDWGCRRWGDHLYDLAWIEFWAPWHPELDVGPLRSELVRRWGAEPDPDRYRACLTHIGADHLVYHAVVGDGGGGRSVLRRMTALGLI